MPMQVALEQIPDRENFYAFMYGPIVLASPTGTENMDGLYADDSRGGHIAHGKQISMQEIPMLVGSAASLPQSLRKIKDDLVAFTYTGSVYPAQKEALKLIPFFRLHDSRYAIYFHQVTEAEVESIRKEVALSEPGINKDRHFRRAKGWFSYNLKVKEEASQLMITVRKEDYTKVAILLNNEKLTVSPTISKPDKEGFITICYSLPQKLSAGSYPIRFSPDGTEWTPAIYEVRLLK